MTERADAVIRIVAELPLDENGLLTIGLQSGEDVDSPVLVREHRELVVEPSFRITALPDGRPNFLGPFAHGPREGRFVYLVWQHAGARVGRSKIPLGSIGWHDLDGDRPPVLRVRLVDERGAPRFATVRPT